MGPKRFDAYQRQEGKEQGSALVEAKSLLKSISELRQREGLRSGGALGNRVGVLKPDQLVSMDGYRDDGGERG